MSMFSNRMLEALNKQINAELDSFYVYLSMAAYFESINLEGFVNWMRAQSQEEMDHALKIYDFVHEREGRVVLGSVAKPPHDWKSVEEAFAAAYDQEVDISRKIDAIVDLAVKEGDHATHSFLQWFVNEQVEEIKTVNTIINKLKLIQGHPSGLFLLDQEMGQRSMEPSA